MKAFLLTGLIGISILVLPLFGQSAADYFHNGAQLYIHGNLPQALAIVTEGLARYPSDARLKGLLEKIKEKQQQQQQNQQQQQSSNQENSQQNKQQEKENQQQQQKQKEEDQQKAQNNQPEQSRQPQDQQKSQPLPRDEKQLTREEAERLLKALQGKVDNTKKRPYRIVGKKKKVEKDW